MKKYAGIALGANWRIKSKDSSTPEFQLRRAIELLRTLFPDESYFSQIIETEPLGPQDQPNFSNAAMVVRSSDSPERLLRILKGIEVCLGRQLRRRWGERELDLDLIFVEGVFRESKSLKLPHPEAKFRKFVTEPLKECLSQCPTLDINLEQILSAQK